jgi:hypothetical protein
MGPPGASGLAAWPTGALLAMKSPSSPPAGFALLTRVKERDIRRRSFWVDVYIKK